MDQPIDQLSVPLWRRLAAACYDALVLAAVFFIGAALAMMVSRGAITPDHPLAELLFRLYLLALGFAFFGGFWVRNGQTLGMLAWRVKVVQTGSGTKITWSQALVRYLAAYLSWLPLGLGFWWSLWDKDQRTWHDRLSGTQLVSAPSFTEISNPKD
ncbi:MAG TPA: RDD family protein [Gammaproteobacteria bacterium]|nr:RDD family protein [Gammaproteobacteria bacterium]